MARLEFAKKVRAAHFLQSPLAFAIAVANSRWLLKNSRCQKSLQE